MSDFLYSYYTFRYVSLFLGVLVALFIVMAFYSLVKMRRSKAYRKEISDMYVASKIKEIAKNDGLDLSEEYSSFLQWCKKKKFEDKQFDYDEIVEEELANMVEKELADKKLKKKGE